MGCQKTATDANGKVFDTQIEETDRLKKLQRKLHRQKKGSNNRWKTIKKLHKEYRKLDNKKDAAAIRTVMELLDENDVLIIQDESLRAWKRKHGRKVQHGILGRIKSRLVASPNVHVINKWVPTTKLCSHCGKMFKDIEEKDRQFVCPHCGHDDGERDQHSAKNMVWLYQNMKDTIGLDGAKFKRSEFDEGLAERFSSA